MWVKALEAREILIVEALPIVPVLMDTLDALGMESSVIVAVAVILL